MMAECDPGANFVRLIDKHDGFLRKNLSGLQSARSIKLTRRGDICLERPDRFGFHPRCMGRLRTIKHLQTVRPYQG